MLCISVNVEDDPSMVPIIKTRIAYEERREITEIYTTRMFHCTLCSYYHFYNTHNQITKHMIDVHGCVALFKCEQCSEIFVTEEHLKQHESFHASDFIANCLHCSKEFTDRELYEAHMSAYMNNPYICVICHRVFIDRYPYKSHFQAKHPSKKFQLRPPKTSTISIIDNDPHIQPEPVEVGEFSKTLIQDSNFVPHRNSTPLEYVLEILDEYPDGGMFIDYIEDVFLALYPQVDRSNFNSLRECIEEIIFQKSIDDSNIIKPPFFEIPQYEVVHDQMNEDQENEFLEYSI